MPFYNFDQHVDREQTSCVKYDLRDKVFHQSDVIPMWVADMDFETPEFIRKAVAERAAHPIYGYTFRNESYVESIRNWVLRRHQWETQSDWFVFSPGIVPAVNLAVLALTKPGDGVLIQTPVYFPFFNAVNDHERKLLTNRLVYADGKYSIDFEDFEAKVKKARMFIMSSPHNPVGRVWSREELTRMGTICQKYGVVIIADEIHNDLILPGNHHTVMATLSPNLADITLTCIAPSKTFNMAGLATSSVVVSNPELRKLFSRYVEKLHLSGGNIFGAVASIAGYSHGDVWVDELMEYVAKNLAYLKEQLTNHTNIKLVEPEATYMAWLDFSATGLDDETIKSTLINKARLGLSHGPMFGSGGELFQRINLATTLKVVEEATQRMISTFRCN